MDDKTMTTEEAAALIWAAPRMGADQSSKPAVAKQ